jgi:hypothetical protein
MIAAIQKLAAENQASQVLEKTSHLGTAKV